MSRASLVAVLLVGPAAGRPALAGVSWHGTTRYGETESTRAGPTTEATEIRLAKKVELKIVYDNNAFDPELKTAWGFACYIDT